MAKSINFIRPLQSSMFSALVSQINKWHKTKFYMKNARSKGLSLN